MAVSPKHLPQLAVLAAAPVVKRNGLLLLVGFLLAGDAKAHAGESIAPGLRYFLTAFLAMAQAITFGQAAPGASNFIVDGILNLILYGVVAGPTACHDVLLYGAVYALLGCRCIAGHSRAIRPFAGSAACVTTGCFSSGRDGVVCVFSGCCCVLQGRHLLAVLVWRLHHSI